MDNHSQAVAAHTLDIQVVDVRMAQMDNQVAAVVHDHTVHHTWDGAMVHLKADQADLVHLEAVVVHLEVTHTQANTDAVAVDMNAVDMNVVEDNLRMHSWAHDGQGAHDQNAQDAVAHHCVEVGTLVKAHGQEAGCFVVGGLLSAVVFGNLPLDSKRSTQEEGQRQPCVGDTVDYVVDGVVTYFFDETRAEVQRVGLLK